jgi:hypothetical protein
MPRFRHAAGPLGLLLLCVGFYWKLALTDQYVWFDHPDMCYLELPRLQFQVNEIHRGQFPLWDPRIWAGQPLIGQTQPGPLYPFNLAFALLPLTNTGHIKTQHLNWYWVFIHFQAVLFCYWLARDLGRSRMASVIAGTLFGLGGFIGSVAWLDVVNGAVWTPLVFLFLLRAIRGESPRANAMLGGCVLGVAWLAGHHEIPMLVSYLAAFTWIFHMFRKRRLDRQIAIQAGLFFLVMFLISAVQTIPTYEFGRVSRRWIGLENSVGWSDTIPYIAHTTYSMPVRGLLGLAVFGINHADSSPFIGVIGLGLAVFGLLSGWSKSVVRWLTVLTIGSLIYSLGAWTPFHGLFYTLAPMLGKARVTFRAIHLVHFGMAVLAAYGVDAIVDRNASHTRKLTWFLGIAGALLAIVVPLIGVATGHSAEIDDKMMLSGWTALGVSALIAIYQTGHITSLWMAGSVLGLILIELNALQNYPSRFDKDRFQFVKAMEGNRDIADYLRLQPEPVRVAVNDNDIPANFGDYHRIDMLQGYVAGASENLLRFGLHTREMRRIFAVDYWISKEPERPEQIEVFKGSSGVRVFKNPEAMPRAWAAREGVRVKNTYELSMLIENPGFDPRQTVAFLNTEPPKLDPCPSSGEVAVRRHHSNRITLNAKMPCRGIVVLADTYFTGWRATVDGKSTDILETYGALRGVVVDAGEHEIEMRYQPVSVFAGGVLTILGIVISGVAWRRSRQSS